MFAFNYYELYRNSKDPVQYRGMLVEYALKHGIKPTAREFKTTPKTVRKWVERFKAEKKPGLQNRSRKPHASPNQMKPYWYYKIQDICTQAQSRHKRITATWIQKTYTIPYSTRTICKVMHQVGFMPQKRKKYQRSRDLREIKRQLKAFQKVQVDIKYLDDIPELYQAYKAYNLPRYQITARCVRTGALFYSYALEKSSTNTTLFMLYLADHFKRYGVPLEQLVIQTDNGTEFTMPWNSLRTSVFTKTITEQLHAHHVLIPPGAKTWQSDVETSHRLIEDEFYAREEFTSYFDFLCKAAQYQEYFNTQRYNRYKEGSPLDILQAIEPAIDSGVLCLKPVIIDNLYGMYKDVFRALAA